MKFPTPLPSTVKLSEVVGLELVLQQIPLDATAAPPLLVMFPPDKAEIFVISETDWVVNVAKSNVVKLISRFVVPPLFVAYAFT